MSLFRFFQEEKVCRFLVDPEGKAAKKYAKFKQLLDNNNEILDILAKLEEVYFGGGMFTMSAISEACQRLRQATTELIESLQAISGGRHAGLIPALTQIEQAIQPFLDRHSLSPQGPIIVDLAEVDHRLMTLTGGKGTNLGTIRNTVKLPTPDGFVITAAGFASFIGYQSLEKHIAAALDHLSPFDLVDLEQRSQTLRQQILAAPFPPDLEQAILQGFDRLTARLGGVFPVAMRSSAVGEDSQASFAGQYETVLHVTKNTIIQAYKTVVASKYTPKAILYRLRYGLDESDTPMAVLALHMVLSRTSGVLYTVDPSTFDAESLRVDAVWGLGELLVSGRSSVDSFSLKKYPLALVEQTIAEKKERMIGLPGGGTRVEPVPTSEISSPCLDESHLLELARHGLALEAHFKAPQDVEWAVDNQGRLFILQSRPLEISGSRTEPTTIVAVDLSKHTPLLSGGKTAAAGAASGEVVRIIGSIPQEIPQGSIIVSRNAAPELAALLDRAGGIITDLGGVASHLASVARELGVPALFDTGNATEILKDGILITLNATSGQVYPGQVNEILSSQTRRKGHVYDSPMHQRLRAILDLISPLHLLDPTAPNFSPEGCQTIHDIVRYAHEKSMKEMFGLVGHAEDNGVLVARMKAKIPLVLYCLDLGGGLRENMTTCDNLSPDDVRSTPMRALWKGMTHPGITWSGAIGFTAGNVMSLMASSITANVDGGTPGGDSYALLSKEYVNFSAKFGYHFANVDALCGESLNQNYVNLRFAGGAGGYAGKCLRLSFLAEVLHRLGFQVTVTGDVLDAMFKGFDQTATEAALDQLGRLLASSRLLDMAITNQAAIESMTTAFFRGDYNYLEGLPESPLPNFYLPIGDWTRTTEDGVAIGRQDGTKWATGISRSFADLMGRMAGTRYVNFLDSIEAYFYFPLAIAKDVELGDGRVSLQMKLIGGSIDRAGGLAFGVKNFGNYLVLRVNALEDNIILFQFKDGKRVQLASASIPVSSATWHGLTVEVKGGTVTGFLNGKTLLIYHLDQPIKGHIGLWTKADSVTDFKDLTVESGDVRFCVSM